MATEAALAGKDIYVQKPVTYDIAESIALRSAKYDVHRIARA